MIALSCAVWMGNDYERHQHERLCVKLGFDIAWIGAVCRLDAEGQSVLGDDEALVQRLVLTMLDSKGKAAGSLFEETVARLGQAEAMAVLMVVGRYVVHGLIVNSLDLAPPVPSIFAGERA